MKSIVAGCLLLFTTSLHADTGQDGNAWHGVCNLAGESGRTSCGFFVMGYLNGVRAQATLSKSAAFFCFHEGAIYRQAVDVFSKYLADHPERRHYEGTVLLAAAMMEAFPCAR